MSLKKHQQAVTPARALALEVLGRMERSNVGADDVFDAEAQAMPGLRSDDRALAHEIVYGVLRWRRRLDAIISEYANREPDDRVAIVLRAGVYQLVFLDRIPVFAAVNTTVEATKAVGRRGAAGFVNAVLRKVAARAERHRTQAPPAADAGHAAWAQWASFPDWMVDVLAGAVGEDALGALLTASNEPAPLVLRARPGQADELADAVGGSRGRWADDAVHVPSGAGKVTELPGFAEGRFVVQDEGAQLITKVLGVQPGMSVLDVGAAPGGKALHAVDLGAEVVALDVAARRMERVRESAERLGSELECVVGDVCESVPALEGRTFDRVLVDAPCTGLGIIRRKPDIKWARIPEDVARLAKRQREILRSAAAYVKPGGALVYAVCTITDPETRGVAEALVTEAGLERGDALADLPKLATDFSFDGRDFRSLPHTHGLDGFYAARWTRPA